MKLARTIAIVLLVILGISALSGGLVMVAGALKDPGQGMMSMSLLEHTPFHSYLIPGVILLVANGLLPMWVVQRVLTNKAHYSLWIALQGCVLVGWIVVQCVMLQLVIGLHYLYGGMGLALIACGLILWQERAVTPRHQE